MKDHSIIENLKRDRADLLDVLKKIVKDYDYFIGHPMSKLELTIRFARDEVERIEKLMNEERD